MKKFSILLFLICYLEFESASQDLKEQLKESLTLASEQYTILDNILPDSLFPRSVDSAGGLVMNRSGWWTSGFFPAGLWLLYDFTGDPLLKDVAVQKTRIVEREKLNASDHDLGFKIFCPFGNALKITGEKVYEEPIITAANTLLTRYDASIGLIRSWGNMKDSGNFPVIIDNMMNLELLFEASKMTGDKKYYEVAIRHADNTIRHHFREDGSSFHVVNFDPVSKALRSKKTAQGFSDGSAWARGQAWGFYGFVNCYRLTGEKRYLEQAQKIASFILDHPRLPADGVPYWDFDAPDIPGAYRDVSAAAIMASAFIDLAKFSGKKEAGRYTRQAEKILATLSSPQYRTVMNEKHNFLLKHGVGHLPAGSEVDVPLSYADYYYIEAAVKLLKKNAK